MYLCTLCRLHSMYPDSIGTRLYFHALYGKRVYWPLSQVFSLKVGKHVDSKSWAIPDVSSLQEVVTPSVVAHDSNSSTQAVEAGISGSQGRLQLQRKFKAGRAPGSMRHCLWKWKQYKKRSGSCHITPLGSQMKIWWLGGWDNMPRRVLMISSGWSWTVHSLASASKVGHHTARSEPFLLQLVFCFILCIKCLRSSEICYNSIQPWPITGICPTVAPHCLDVGLFLC